MKPIIPRLTFVFISCHFSFLIVAQTQMKLSFNNKEGNIYGYTLGSSSSGNAKEIDVFGALENVNPYLTSSSRIR